VKFKKLLLIASASLLAMSLLNCSTPSSVQNQATKNEIFKEAHDKTTAVDLIKCKWVGPVREDVITEYFYTLEEIMNEYRACYVLRNSRIDRE